MWLYADAERLGLQRKLPRGRCLVLVSRRPAFGSDQIEAVELKVAVEQYDSGRGCFYPGNYEDFLDPRWCCDMYEEECCCCPKKVEVSQRGGSFHDYYSGLVAITLLGDTSLEKKQEAQGKIDQLARRLRFTGDRKKLMLGYLGNVLDLRVEVEYRGKGPPDHNCIYKRFEISNRRNSPQESFKAPRVPFGEPWDLSNEDVYQAFGDNLRCDTGRFEKREVPEYEYPLEDIPGTTIATPDGDLFDPTDNPPEGSVFWTRILIIVWVAGTECVQADCCAAMWAMAVQIIDIWPYSLAKSGGFDARELALCIQNNKCEEGDDFDKAYEKIKGKAKDVYIEWEQGYKKTRSDPSGYREWRKEFCGRHSDK